MSVATAPVDVDYDVVVIGGGVAGAASAQNLAAQGFRTLLVEANDFASGTSSRSSRLLYCGLAYFSPEYPIWKFALRPYDLFARFRMARLAMKNRTHIAVNTPERVTRHQFFFPIHKDGEFPPWKVGLGYRLLSLFGSKKAPLGYHHLDVETGVQRHGLLRHMEQGNLRGFAAFQEYQYNWAERICLDTVMDAERCGAKVANYTPVTAITRQGEDWRLTLSPANGPYDVTTRMIVNTAGPWADRLLRLAIPAPRQHLVGIKGVNVVVKLPDDCRGQGIETISSRKEPFYLMPWGDYHFFGPTETVFDGPPEQARVLPEEVDFILAEANRVFPGFALTRKDVVYTWCGVRPRTSLGRKTGIKSFMIHDMAPEGMPNAITVTSVPIMIHRSAGRDIAAAVSRRVRPTGTAARLSYAARLLPTNGAQIGGVSVASLRAAAQTEHVRSLQDLMFRRVNMGWQADMGLPAARQVAEAVADILGWDSARIEAEVAAYRAFVIDNFLPAAADPSRMAVAS